MKSLISELGTILGGIFIGIDTPHALSGKWWAIVGLVVAVSIILGIALCRAAKRREEKTDNIIAARRLEAKRRAKQLADQLRAL